MCTRSHASDSEIPNLGRNPSPFSRLGDVGYIDQTGSWRRVVNILERSSCEQLGLKALPLERPFKEYIKPGRHIYLTEPVVQLSGSGSGFQIYTTGKAFASVINPEDRKEFQVASNQGKQVDRGVVITPVENNTTAAFIVGPITCVKKMNLPSATCHAWVQYNQTSIRRAARKVLSMFPPDKTTTAMSLALTEFFTETWRSLYIRAEAPASPVFVGFTRGNTETSGMWNVVNIPNSTSTITSGFASFPDGTEWVVGSGGIRVAFPSRVRIYWLVGCFKHVDEEDLEQMQPVPLPPSSKVESQ